MTIKNKSIKSVFLYAVLVIISVMPSFAQEAFGTGNTYKNIPVEVIGVPYSYSEIRGPHSLDYLIDSFYDMFSKGQQSTFTNFRINKFVYEFKNDGSLVLSIFYSYDQTPAGGNSFYPAKDNDVHKWPITPQYHNHLQGNCSLDRFDEIAISQGKLNEMIKDPNMKKMYDVFYSVALDMDYDYNRVGIRAKFVTPTPLKGVCDDYSDLLISRLRSANIPGVTDITKVSGQNHAWVTLKYKGRLLYLDATWFDTNIIDETGTVVHTPYKDSRNFTYDNDIFTNHGKHHLPGR
jgi:transglutaminase-like putative cysteine protease